MASKSKRARLAPQRDLKKTFLYWTLAFFLVKLILIYKLPAHAWLGADGENYIRAYEALTRDGLFSKEENLHYWPAGYPIFLWMVYGFYFYYCVIFYLSSFLSMGLVVVLNGFL